MTPRISTPTRKRAADDRKSSRLRRQRISDRGEPSAKGHANRDPRWNTNELGMALVSEELEGGRADAWIERAPTR